MPPKMDRAEAAFDAVQAQLEERNIVAWKPQEMEIFLSLVQAYYTELKTQSILAKRHARRAGHTVDQDADVSVEEKEEEEEEEEEALRHEAAVAEVDRALAKLRAFLQSKVPFGSLQEPAVLPYVTGSQTDNDSSADSEKKPKTERAAAATVDPVVYAVDAFLFQEEDVEELAELGAISRHYCTDCGSTNLAPTDFITHSFSQDQLIFLTCFLLPALGEEGPEVSTRTIVDVGSRLGIVLWASYFAAKAQVMVNTEKVIGIELDPRLVKLQQEVGKRFCSTPVRLSPTQDQDPRQQPAKYLTWTVEQSDCFLGRGAAALAEGDVIILHNVFEYFCKSEAEHLQCWLKLRALVKRKGQVLVCVPSIEETFMAFNEQTLEACGILPAEDTASAQDKPTGAKRPRKGGKALERPENEVAEDAQAEAFAPPGRKELAVARWISEYLEPIDDEVEQLAEDFISFRTAMLQQDEEDEEEGDDSEDGDDGHGHAHRHTDGCCGGKQQEPSELEEQIRNVWVYKVK